MMYSRRTAIQLCLALWAKAEQHVHAGSSNQPSGAGFDPKFLKPEEVTTIQRFAAVMIPVSERSGGAAAAHVETYFDRVLSGAAPSLQRTWRAGLASWARARDTDAHLRRLAVNEFEPKSKADQFFVLFKSALTAAFYTSEEGIVKELGYQGMGFLREFPGYQGEVFAKPADYQPVLKARR